MSARTPNVAVPVPAAMLVRRSGLLTLGFLALLTGLAGASSGFLAAGGCLAGGLVTWLNQSFLSRGLAMLLATRQPVAPRRRVLVAFLARQAFVAATAYLTLVVARCPPAWFVAGVSVPPFVLAFVALRSSSSAWAATAKPATPVRSEC